MKALVLAAAFAIGATGMGWTSTPSHASGCIKGALIDGAAGHFLGHHGLLGAGAGCIIGHHEASKHAREHERAAREGYGSSAPPADRDGYVYR